MSGRGYIGHAWFAPPMVEPTRPMARFLPSAECYARWRKHLLDRAAGHRWDLKTVGAASYMLPDTQAAMHNLRLARAEARRLT